MTIVSNTPYPSQVNKHYEPQSPFEQIVLLFLKGLGIGIKQVDAEYHVVSWRSFVFDNKPLFPDEKDKPILYKTDSLTDAVYFGLNYVQSAEYRANVHDYQDANGGQS